KMAICAPESTRTCRSQEYNAAVRASRQDLGTSLQSPLVPSIIRDNSCTCATPEHQTIRLAHRRLTYHF
ncbi:MAG: hypothetical protein OXI44_02015, partial [Bacteroidota bacterium]|nr:hypothetical protein [Bacteroidota bacterium]